MVRSKCLFKRHTTLVIAIIILNSMVTKVIPIHMLGVINPLPLQLPTNMRFAFCVWESNWPCVYHNWNIAWSLSISCPSDTRLSKILVLHVPQDILSTRTLWTPNILQLEHHCSVDVVILKLRKCQHVTKSWVQEADSCCLPKLFVICTQKAAVFGMETSKSGVAFGLPFGQSVSVWTSSNKK